MVVIRPILGLLNSVNQRLPSDPTVINLGKLSDVGVGNSVIIPLCPWVDVEIGVDLDGCDCPAFDEALHALDKPARARSSTRMRG